MVIQTGQKELNLMNSNFFIQMNIRGQLKHELKKDPNNRIFYHHQSFAETAVNALEQRTLLDIESEP